MIIYSIGNINLHLKMFDTVTVKLYSLGNYLAKWRKL